MQSDKPMLQLALDTLDLDTALEFTRLVAEVVDIIEVGTILCLAEGLSAVKTIKTLYPDRLVLADVRIAEAGGLISKMVFEAGANWVSVLSSATLSTMEVVAKEAFSHGGEVQIELQEDWTMENAMKWQALGIKQVIIHRSRDTEKAGMSWGSKDLDIVKDLSDKGFKVSVTGKLSIDDIAVFKGIPVYAFVAGRAIRDAGNPTQAAKDFQNAIKATWS